MDATHARRGDLKVVLTSPSGTTSTLADLHNDSNDNYAGWTFMSTFNWGEDSDAGVGAAQGKWTVQVSDIRSGTIGDLNSMTLTVYGSAFAAAPVAVADTSYSVSEGSAFSASDADGTTTVGVPSDDGVLANDTGTGTLTATLIDPPTHHVGTFTLNADGTFTYTHDAGEEPTDSFRYQVSDGSLQSPARTVSITINPINDVPVGVADSIALDEGATATTLVEGPDYTSVLDNDTDAEGTTLTATLIDAPAYHVGTFTLETDGTFTYTHDGSETTSDSFTYQASDGTDSTAIITVSITINPVNDVPVGVDDSIQLDEGATATALVEGSGAASVLHNDSDTVAEGQTLTAVLVTPPAYDAAFAGNFNPDGTFSYTHDGSETTSDSFTYRASDGTDQSELVTVSITINPINDVPVGVADSIALDEGATATTLVEGPDYTSVLDNDTDAEGTTLTATLIDAPAYHVGTFTLETDGTFTYTHDGSETTSDSFTYQASDGTDSTAIITVSITINPVNDVPVGVDDSIQLDEGATATALVEGSGAASVLHNDSDTVAEGQTLTAVLVTPPAYDAAFAGNFNPDGTFSYTHDGSETTSDSFTYRASDGTDQSELVTVSITITTSNDQPTVSPIPDFVWSEDESPTDVDLTSYFDDEEDSAGGLTYSIVSNSTPGLFSSLPITSGVISFSLANGQTGSSTLTVRGTDTGPLFVETSFTITVDTLLAWRVEKFSAVDLANSGLESTVWGDAADPDLDGRDNLMEFALGFDPLVSDFSADQLSSALVDSQFRITFWQRTNDSLITYLPEVSADSITWLDASDPSLPLSLIGAPTAIDAEFEKVVWEDQTAVATGSPRFIHLKVTR